MTIKSRATEVDEVDRFMAEPKALLEGLPQWTQSHIKGRWTAAWPIEMADGVVLEGTRLVFTGPMDDPSQLSISLLFRNSRVHAVDLVPGHVRKNNPSDAGRRFGLPSHVVGSHFHDWQHNRELALELGLGRLPYRSPTPKALTRLPHGLAALCQAINLTLTAEQASFDVPPQGTLLAKGGRYDV